MEPKTNELPFVFGLKNWPTKYVLKIFLYFLIILTKMSLTKAQKRILYALGQCYQKLNQPYQDKPLTVFVSKIAFIELLQKAEFIKKQPRALYKNLELLEKKK